VQEVFCVSEDQAEFEEDVSTENSRYRLLIEITDRVTRAKSLPDAFKEIAPPVLALTGCELLNISLHDPSRDCMLSRAIGRGTRTVESLTLFRWTRPRQDGPGNISEQRMTNF
jgi:hypothetical protein